MLNLFFRDRCRSLLLPIVVALVLTQTSGSARGGDWPQILGPHRNGTAEQESLLDTWLKDGPPTVWSAAVGEGFAGVAVKGDLLVLFHRVGDEEIVQGMNAADGEVRWKASSPCSFQAAYSSDAGPRCVPVIADDRVYTFGVAGRLQCLNASTGQVIWFRDTWKDFSAPEGYFGAGSSPVLHDGRLLVNVGGRQDAAVVAFDAKSGATLWQSFDDSASYSSPIVTTVGDNAMAIVVTRLNTVFLNPQDGTVLGSFAFGMRGPTVNGANPVVMNDHVFVSASYRVGSAWADLRQLQKEPVLAGEELLATQYATPIIHNNLMYAVDGRQDVGTASLKCLDPATQKVLWEEGGFEYGTLLRVNDEFLFLTCGGELIRFDADSQKFVASHRSRILENTPRSYRLPAISHGYLFVRDDAQLKCLHVGPRG